MTTDEMLADIRIVYRLAAEAGVDHRTVIAALRGRIGKGLAYRRAMEVIASWPPKSEPCTECAALRARVAELEAEKQASDAALAVALMPPFPQPVPGVRLPPATPVPPPEPEPPPLPAPPPRPAEHCHVRLELAGRDLLAG